LTPSDLPLWFHLSAAGLFGACLGSFLNVVIARVPEGRSVVRPGSACPRCRAAIRWYDNVPVLSWLALRARCRHCAQPISARYPLVEVLVAGAAVLSVWRHGPGMVAVAELAFTSTLVALAAIDLDTWLLPHALTLPLVALGLGASAFGLTPARTLTSAALGAATGAGLFWLIAVVGTKVFKREAMGFGDVVLLGAIGAFLGLPALLPVVLLSSLQGALVGLVQLWLGRAEPGPGAETAREEAPAVPGGEADDWTPPRHALPFGPFLALAALEWLVWRGQIAAAVPGLDVFL